VLTLLKAIVVFFFTLLAACLAGLLYGMLAHFFDLFFLFPFVVAGLIVSVGSGAARWFRLRNTSLLVLIGLLTGSVAYPAYLAGKYGMLVVAQQLATTAGFADILTILKLFWESPEQLGRAISETDAALLAKVGYEGVLGILFTNLQSGIPIRTSMIGQGNLVVGALIELFKLGVLLVVSATALPNTVRAEALYRTKTPRPMARRELSPAEEELWGRGE
jgi:hypothetical protein